MGTSDMLKWYLSFYSKPEWIGLSKATRDAMLTPFIEGYAQGIGVGKPDPLTHWPPHVSYIGGIGSFFTEMGMWTNTVDPKSSDVVAVWVNRGLLNLPEAVRKGESCSDPDTGKGYPMAICTFLASNSTQAGPFSAMEYTTKRVHEIWDLGVWHNQSAMI